MQEYRNLRVWDESTDLAVEVHKISEQFAPAHRFTLTSQMRRSAVSIPSNIAEGCGRSSDKETARFFEIALGSAFELEAQIELCRRMGLHGELDRLLDACNRVKRSLIRLLTSVHDAMAD